jgi:hypothetical protein
MKHEQFELIISRSHFRNWNFVLEPTVIVDYQFQEEKYFIEYVSLTPEIMLQLRPTAILDILEEVNKAVHEKVIEGLNDNYMYLLERVGVTQKERGEE